MEGTCDLVLIERSNQLLSGELGSILPPSGEIGIGSALACAWVQSDDIIVYHAAYRAAQPMLHPASTNVTACAPLSIVPLAVISTHSTSLKHALPPAGYLVPGCPANTLPRTRITEKTWRPVPLPIQMD